MPVPCVCCRASLTDAEPEGATEPRRHVHPGRTQGQQGPSPVAARACGGPLRRVTGVALVPVQLRMHRFNPRAIRVYLVQSSLLLRFIVSLLTYAHLALFVGEPSYSHDSTASDYLPGVLAVESAIILVYVIDTAMLAYHMGVRDLLASWWNVIFLFVAAAMVVDVSGTWAAWGVVRFSRPMRPFMVAFHNQHLRRVVQSIVASLPSVAEMMLFTVFVTFIYSAVAVQLLQVRRGSVTVCAWMSLGAYRYRFH